MERPGPVFSSSNWSAARLYNSVGASAGGGTGMRGCELKRLLLKDVDLVGGTVTIRRGGTKTDAGARIIPLNKGQRGHLLDSYNVLSHWGPPNRMITYSLLSSSAVSRRMEAKNQDTIPLAHWMAKFDKTGWPPAGSASTICGTIALRNLPKLASPIKH
jgi:integrase